MDNDGKYQLVHERKYVFGAVIDAARLNHALFAKYDIGGADEHLFSQYCQRGTITAVCRDQTCLTINGKTARSRILNNTCSSYLEQPAIGAAIPNLSLGDP